MENEPASQTPEEMMAILKAYGQSVNNQPIIETDLRALFPNDVEPLMRIPELVMVHCSLNITQLEQLPVPERHAMILSAIRLEQKARSQVASDSHASTDNGQELPELTKLCDERQSVTIDNLPDWVFKVVDVLWKNGMNRGDTILDCCLDALNLDRKRFSEQNVRWALRKLVTDGRLERWKFTPKKWGPGFVGRIGTRPPETSLQNFDYIPVSNVKTLPARLAIDDIDSFAQVINISPASVIPHLKSAKKYLDWSEESVQVALEQILGMAFHKKDWGGETNDLYTANTVVSGKRVPTAFLLKGNGLKKTTMEISDCGKNGDQIVRLLDSPASLFVIQFVGAVSEAVIKDIEGKVNEKRHSGKHAWYCIIDGQDTARILKAYGKLLQRRRSKPSPKQPTPPSATPKSPSPGVPERPKRRKPA